MIRGDFTDEVFGWLAEGLNSSPPAYLKLLGPSRDELGARVLANLSAVANRLRDRPEDWAALIRARNWRHTLIGCSAVLLVREVRFLDDLLYRFRQGSWVASQLAVALGLVHPAEAVTEFEAVLRQPDSSTGFKGIFSAYAVLRLMGSAAAHEFEASDLFRRSQAERPGTSAPGRDWLVVVQVVQRQWDFWTSQDCPRLTEGDAAGRRG
jgi:hypothetical protein